jgi:hypothetical protein
MNPIRRVLDAMFGPAASPGPDDLVLLGEPSGEAEAELWRNILAQWGVHCLVKNVSATAYLRLGDQFLVYVLQQDLEYARELVGLAPRAASPDPHDLSAP